MGDDRKFVASSVPRQTEGADLARRGHRMQHVKGPAHFVPCIAAEVVSLQTSMSAAPCTLRTVIAREDESEQGSGSSGAETKSSVLEDLAALAAFGRQVEEDK